MNFPPKSVKCKSCPKSMVYSGAGDLPTNLSSIVFLTEASGPSLAVVTHSFTGNANELAMSTKVTKHGQYFNEVHIEYSAIKSPDMLTFFTDKTLTITFRVTQLYQSCNYDTIPSQNVNFLRNIHIRLSSQVAGYDLFMLQFFFLRKKSFIPLRWRHNDHAGVSNHQPNGCLLNRLFRRRSNKTSKLRVTGLCAGNSPGPVNSPHKGPVTRKMFPFDDVIMRIIDTGAVFS